MTVSKRLGRWDELTPFQPTPLLFDLCFTVIAKSVSRRKKKELNYIEWKGTQEIIPLNWKALSYEKSELEPHAVSDLTISCESLTLDTRAQLAH